MDRLPGVSAIGRELMSSSQLLRGRVTDGAGAAPAGAVTVHRFSLRAGSRVVRLKARPDGTFEVPIGIPAVVLASSTIGGAAAAPATGYEPGFALKLHPRSEIRGRVSGPDGAPLPGVKVTQVYVLRFADKLVYAMPRTTEAASRGGGRTSSSRPVSA
jgi:hypothetical protein